jgi:hypothetical protein
MGKRSGKPHSIGYYMAHLTICEDPRASNAQLFKVPPAGARARFECGCVTAETDSYGTLYYLDTCGDEHHELFS